MRLRNLAMIAILGLALIAPIETEAQTLRSSLEMYGPPKAPTDMYILNSTDLEENPVTGDFTSVTEWENNSGKKMSVVLVASSNLEPKVYFILLIRDNSMIGFGRTERPVNHLKKEYLVTNPKKVNLNRPYVLRRNGDTFEVVTKSSRAKENFEIFESFYQDFVLPIIENRSAHKWRLTKERLTQILETEDPEKWRWITKMSTAQLIK